MPHVSFIEALNVAASSDWGQNHKSENDAAKSLMQGNLSVADIASLDLIHRINKAVIAFGAKQKPSFSSPKKDGTEKAFPSATVGTVLWSGGLESGFGRSIVVAVDDNGLVQCVSERDTDDQFQPWVYWAGEEHFLTLNEAVKHVAITDVEFHTARLNHANSAIEAVENGGDLEPFMNGLHDE